MISLAIAEDEGMYRTQLQQYLHQYEKGRGCAFSLSVYTDGDEIVENFSCQFDIILLDIKMQFMDGMTAAEKIRQQDSQVIIMFITNMVNYAIRGYAVDALDYILKPITYFSFAQKLDRAIGRLDRREKEETLSIQQAAGIQKIEIGKIIYIENDAHILVFHTARGEIRSYLKMQDMEERLASRGFYRINKGCLVNMRYVDGIGDGCALVGQEKLVISRARKKDFMDALTKYMGDQ